MEKRNYKEHVCLYAGQYNIMPIACIFIFVYIFIFVNFNIRLRISTVMYDTFIYKVLELSKNNDLKESMYSYTYKH